MEEITNENKENIKKNKKPYVTKEQRKEFIQWYLRKYGYNVNLKINNSRVVSEQYEKETGIIIPKISIYRWLGKLEQGEVNKFAKEFIDPVLINPPELSTNSINIIESL